MEAPFKNILQISHSAFPAFDVFVVIILCFFRSPQHLCHVHVLNDLILFNEWGIISGFENM